MTPEELQKIIKRESERAFGPLAMGDPRAFVNKAADDVWKQILEASGNDPRVLKEWRDDIKSRSTGDGLEDPSGKQATSKRGKTRLNAHEQD